MSQRNAPPTDLRLDDDDDDSPEQTVQIGIDELSLERPTDRVDRASLERGAPPPKAVKPAIVAPPVAPKDVSRPPPAATPPAPTTGAITAPPPPMPASTNPFASQVPQSSMMRGAPPASMPPQPMTLGTLHGGFAAPGAPGAAASQSGSIPGTPVTGGAIPGAGAIPAAAPQPQQAAPPAPGSMAMQAASASLAAMPAHNPFGPNAHAQTGSHGAASGASPSLALRADAPRDFRPAALHVVRSKAYSFVLDQRGAPIEVGSGRFAKAYLGEERWLESKTDFRREVVIKILQKGVSEEDQVRFQMEKELLERVQGHPNIVELFASGDGEDTTFIPPSIRDKVEPEFMILERLEMSLEERLKGSRNKGQKDELLTAPMHERVFRVLDYMIPIASAVEYAHLIRNVCHRDLKPANVLIGLPDPTLRGSSLQIRLADFNVAKLNDDEVQFGVTAMKGAVPGTQFFQSPEQETNIIELLVNCQQGVPEVEYFEDFYIHIAKNDMFSLWNRNEQYPIQYADRARKRLVLAKPYRDSSEVNVRARIQKSVGRPADIYSLGAVLYYLISGAYANPKTLYDAFHKFIEYERADENNTIEQYLRHEYGVINSLRAPKTDGPSVAPADRFFTYKHYLDGNGELIDPNVMLIIAKCMIRNKPDSYCQAHDLETKGISVLVEDLINLYALYGVHPAARPTHLVSRSTPRGRGALKLGLTKFSSRLRLLWLTVLSTLRKRP